MNSYLSKSNEIIIYVSARQLCKNIHNYSTSKINMINELQK